MGAVALTMTRANPDSMYVAGRRVLLEYLAPQRGRVFTRDQLLDAVWKEGSSVTPRSIDVFIRRLREKINAIPVIRAI